MVSTTLQPLAVPIEKNSENKRNRKPINDTVFAAKAMFGCLGSNCINSFSLRESLCCCNSICHQHCNSHWTHASRHRRHNRRDICDIGMHISCESPSPFSCCIFDSVYSHINYNCTFLYPTGLNPFLGDQLQQ